ncbi:MAG: YbaB/EbfC family nucleoid-associated protein [Myxococcota bacterium]|nr:YbaB/EbfC family nucleoid-associated protein [Myxococcota bacterium]
MSDDKTPPDLDLGNLFGQVMDQARSVQTRMSGIQEKVKTMTAEGSAGGGIVTALATGNGRIQSVRIEPVAVDPRDIEMLEDLITAACNDALRRAQEMVEQEMGSLTGGLDLGELGSMLGKFGG